jgi:type II secretory pathway component PulK
VRLLAKEGYALPLTLAAVASVSLALLAALDSLSGLNRQARDARAALAFVRNADDAEARLLYLAVTGQLTQDRVRGGPALQAEELRLDDRPYRMGDLVVSLQDEAGLVELNFARREVLLRLFVHAGADPVEAGRLADQLGDYVDADDLRREDGAEAAIYRAAGLAPPPNMPLSRPAQLLGLREWQAVMSSERWARVADLVTLSPTSKDLNIDSAPQEALQIGLALPPASARMLIEDRQVRPFYGRLGPRFAGGTTQARLRLTITDPVTGRARRSTLVLTPTGAPKPFAIGRAEPPPRPPRKIDALVPVPDPGL